MGLTCFSSFGSSNVRFGSTLGYHTENERSIIPPQKSGFLLDSERQKKRKAYRQTSTHQLPWPP